MIKFLSAASAAIVSLILLAVPASATHVYITYDRSPTQLVRTGILVPSDLAYFDDVTLDVRVKIQAPEYRHDFDISWLSGAWPNIRQSTMRGGKPIALSIRTHNGRDGGYRLFDGEKGGHLSISTANSIHGIVFGDFLSTEGRNYEMFFDFRGYNELNIGVVGYGTIWQTRGIWGSVAPSPVPLPASAPLLLGAVAVLTALRRNRRKATAA